MPTRPNVWTCGAGLTDALARQVLGGFPLGTSAPADLSRWTILVPTRRAAIALERRLFALSGASALMLPRIRPIGDSDEDLLADAFPQDGVPDAVSAMGQLFLLLGLVQTWAAEHPHLALAQDVAASRGQALGLAQSLAELVNQMETEEIEAELGAAFRDLDLAEHRQTILSLLDLVQQRLPRHLHDLNLMGAAARRNAMLRLEARRIAEGRHDGPIIAAGSTGTNPATRELLKAIARHPHGAVVLPGLDLGLDEESWNSAGPNHPQFALKLLLAHLDVARGEVREFAPAGARAVLAREVMRPAETTERWSDPALLTPTILATARDNLRLIEAPDRQTEARCVALLLREALETPACTAALVTPDRDLAQMVAAELRRWSAEIDDSGGEPLIRFGRAQLCKLAIDVVEEGFAPAALVALLAHPAVTVGFDPATARLLSQYVEMALLRQDLPPAVPADFMTALANMRRTLAADPHAPRGVRTLDDAAWDQITDFTARLAAALAPLQDNPRGTLAGHVARLTTCLEALAPDAGDDATRRPFDDVMAALAQASALHPESTLRVGLSSITWALRQETLRPQRRDGTRLAIYGLAEARMIEADLVVLAGLNESIWPAAADPGPWLNRSMRKSLGLSQPERLIGQTAHDLAQGLQHPHAVLTWSRRAGTAPLMPSRWILRLRALMDRCGVAAEQQTDRLVPALAAALDRPGEAVRIDMPLPRPPLTLRPRHFSVSEIERLIRDPYAIHARRILHLEPLAPLGGSAEPSLRGQLFHEALRRFVEQDTRTLASLIAAGEAVFAPYMTHPDVRHFWWPRFKRMAAAFVPKDAELRADVVASLVECSGCVPLIVAGQEHSLRARADRIDVTQRRTVRIIDYKTGTVPSGKQVKTGLSPQLTLEAAILRHGRFQGDPPPEAEDLIYIRTSGGQTAVDIKSLAHQRRDPVNVAEVAQTHFDGLQRLLTRYQDAAQPYVPRAVMFKEREASDYDHLSRFAEWSRGGS